MKKIPIGKTVKVDGPANQYPFERIIDTGVVVHNARGYLVSLNNHRENLLFKRRDLIQIGGGK